MSERELIPITDPAQIPRLSTTEEKVEFWRTHTLTPECWEKMEPVPEDQLPPARQKEE